MQGQRHTLDSFSETFGLELGSSTNDTGIDQHLYWTGIQSGFLGCPLPPGETNSTNVNAVSCDRGSTSLTGWNVGESSSGDSTRNQMIYDGPATEHQCSSSLSFHAGSAPRLEEQPTDANNTLFPRRFNIDLNSNQEANISLFSQTSCTNEIRHNLNLNTEYTSGSGNDGHFTESGNSQSYRTSGSETAQINSASGSATSFGAVPGRSGYLADEADGIPGCSSGPCLPCKRKTIHRGVSGQSCLVGNPSYLPRSEDSVWHVFPARSTAASSSSTPYSTENIHAPNLLEQLNPPSGIVFRGVTSDRHPAASIAGHAQNSQRNVRRRTNPSQQQDLVPSILTSTGNAARHPPVWPPHQSSRHIHYGHSLNSRPTAANTSSQMQSHIPHVHGLPQNIPPFQYNGALNSGGVSSASSIILAERPVLREEILSRSMATNFSEPMFVPASDMRSLPHIPTGWSLANGNTSNPENFVAASRVGPTSGVYPPQSSLLVPPPIVSTQYSRRLSEVVRRPLYSSAGSESGVQTSNFPSSHSGPSALSQAMVLPSASASSSQGNHQRHHRASLLMNRQGDGAPLSFRSLPAATGRRSRLLSEIRNVLDIVHRGGSDGLTIEDYLILNQSVFFGAPELHDRHRDMRLDVDNMSYEELLALEERIGNVNTGLNEETICKQLKHRKYFTAGVNSTSETEPCCVCQEEYMNGEDLGKLNCGHEFHSECIKQWLTHKNVCPICKTAALATE